MLNAIDFWVKNDGKPPASRLMTREKSERLKSHIALIFLPSGKKSSVIKIRKMVKPKTTTPPRRTIRDLILDGRREEGPNKGMGLRGTLCVDLGAPVTTSLFRQKQEPSHRKGETYVIQYLTDRAPWKPDERRTTLVVQYLKKPRDEVYTYLDERLNDEVIH